MKKTISLFLAVLFSMNVLSAGYWCEICDEDFDQKSAYNSTSKAIGYRLLPKCKHRFHHVCIAVWYLGAKYYSKDDVHVRCFKCQATYGKITKSS